MNIMTVDLESWVHRPIFKIPDREQTKKRDNGHLVEATRKILRIFREYGTHATFFVLGVVAEWYPELIEQIYSEGHEIAVHGYSHLPLINHTRESFEYELSKSIEILKSLSETPIGYRAPIFTLSDFLFDVLV